MPTDAPIQIRDANGTLVYVDNEQVDNEAGLGVRRQLVGAPDIEGVLQAIHLHLGNLNAKTPQPNPVTAAGRVEVLSGTVTTVSTVTAVTTVSTLTTCTTVTTVASVTNIASIGGNSAIAMPLDPFWQLAASQRSRIAVT